MCTRVSAGLIISEGQYFLGRANARIDVSQCAFIRLPIIAVLSPNFYQHPDPKRDFRLVMRRRNFAVPEEIDIEI